MTYDHWKTTEPDPQLDEPYCPCIDCDQLADEEDDDGEFRCKSCLDNRAEAAWERHQQNLMENGPGPSLRDQQEAARKFK